MLGGALEIKGAGMGLSAAQLKASLDALSEIEPAFAAARARIGDPPPRIRDRGYETIVRKLRLVGADIERLTDSAVEAEAA